MNSSAECIWFCVFLCVADSYTICQWRLHVTWRLSTFSLKLYETKINIVFCFIDLLTENAVFRYCKIDLSYECFHHRFWNQFRFTLTNFNWRFCLDNAWQSLFYVLPSLTLLSASDSLFFCLLSLPFFCRSFSFTNSSTVSWKLVFSTGYLNLSLTLMSCMSPCRLHLCQVNLYFHKTNINIIYIKKKYNII